MRVLAVDLGGSHVACAVVEDRTIRCERTLPLSGSDGLLPALATIAETLRSLIVEIQIPLTSCTGIGFGFPGLVDSDHGQVLSTNQKYPDAPDLDLPGWAASELDLPLRLENDARLALLGERFAGAASGYDDVVMMTLGTGIGGAAMIGGHLLKGKHHQAGVLGGHLPVRMDGALCSCGNRGCLEAEASSWALPGLCRSWPGFDRSVLAERVPLDFSTLFQAAREGDLIAGEVRNYCLRAWATGVVALIHAYDPEIVVLGGGVMASAGEVLPFIEDYVHRHAWTPWGEVALRQAALGNQAALLGVVPLFMSRSHDTRDV